MAAVHAERERLRAERTARSASLAATGNRLKDPAYRRAVADRTASQLFSAWWKGTVRSGAPLAVAGGIGLLAGLYFGGRAARQRSTAWASVLSALLPVVLEQLSTADEGGILGELGRSWQRIRERMRERRSGA
jgi:hypothetical protein